MLSLVQFPLANNCHSVDEKYCLKKPEEGGERERERKREGGGQPSICFLIVLDCVSLNCKSAQTLSPPSGFARTFYLSNRKRRKDTW